MPLSPFLDNHSLRNAFLGNLLERLVETIVKQGNNLLENAGLKIPSRAVSTIMLIAERQQISTADIASELGQPHQLVTQRVELLLNLGIIARQTDPTDGRRKILALTARGEQDFQILMRCLHDADAALKELQREINCDLSAATTKAIAALSKSSISARIATTKR